MRELECKYVGVHAVYVQVQEIKVATRRPSSQISEQHLILPVKSWLYELLGAATLPTPAADCST